jgi:nitroreductase/NAD-dependent dihydropyrimidine dehydrogenase PreA subunit
MNAQPRIDPQICEGCGLCAAICPMAIFDLNGQGKDATVTVLEDRADKCIGCGHCMMICSMQSVFVDGLDYETDFIELAKNQIDVDAFENLLISRRSVRVFKDKPVPRETLERIVEMITFAPMGFTPHKNTITVVSHRETIEQGLPTVVTMYEGLQERIAKPISRYFIKRMLDPGGFAALEEHVLPTLKYRLPEMRAGKYDTITRGAPAMLLFHAPPTAAHYVEDSFIALAYGLLAAHALGLGACAIGLIPPVVNRSGSLRALFQIPDGHVVTSCMVLGYPKYRFKRGIRREMAGVNWI